MTDEDTKLPIGDRCPLCGHDSPGNIRWREQHFATGYAQATWYCRRCRHGGAIQLSAPTDEWDVID